MTFDEQLQRTLDTLTNRLRDEIAGHLREEVTRQVQVVSDELAAARSERDSAERTKQEIVERSEREAAEREEREATGRGEREATERAVREATERAAREATEREEREATERTEREAAERAAREATERVEREATERTVRAASERADREAAERGAATRRLAEGMRALGGERLLGDVLDTLVRCAGQEAPRAGVLLVRGDRFHGWRFLGFDPALAIGDRLDIAHDESGVIAQACQSAVPASSGSTDGDAAPAFAQLKAGQACVAVPIVVGGQAVAVLYADAGSESETLNPEALEVLTAFASQRLEALTVIKAARSLTANPDPPSDAPSRSENPGGPGRNDESADQHAAARRYARLLVSEIKLYHEPQVAEGRRERDLATRLGGEIARVRTLYEQRVPAAVRESADYVHEELIRTLADGDASLLEAK